MSPGLILVGVDGSPESRAAVEWTVILAGALSARVLAVHAVGLMERLDREHDPVPASGHLEEIRSTFEHEWCGPLRDLPDGFRTELSYGPPADVLLSLADQEGADLVVIGSRGRGRAARGALGSTSARVAQAAGIPVLIVPGHPRVAPAG